MLVLISLVGLVSAACPGELSYVEGTIYDSSDNTVSDANVTVTWVDGGITHNVYAVSNGSGYYYADLGCNTPNFYVTVSAVKGSLYGSASGDLENNGDFSFAIINVPLVPEFGLVIGGLTILSAVGIFFFVRKR